MGYHGGMWVALWRVNEVSGESIQKQPERRKEITQKVQHTSKKWIIYLKKID